MTSGLLNWHELSRNGTKFNADLLSDALEETKPIIYRQPNSVIVHLKMKESYLMKESDLTIETAHASLALHL